VPPPVPSISYERLSAQVAQRMRVSRIDQPLMLLEHLGRRSPPPAHDVAEGFCAAMEPSDAERDEEVFAHRRGFCALEGSARVLLENELALPRRHGADGMWG
jgi:hypothetical protein